MKKKLFGKDYGFPIDSACYELSNSNLRKEYEECILNKSEAGPLIVDEILRRCGGSKYFKAFLKGIDFGESDWDSLKLFKISREMKINFENIFEDQNTKRYLLKNRIHYKVFISGRDEITGKIIYEPIDSCKGTRIGRVFQRVCEKGKKLEKIINEF